MSTSSAMAHTTCTNCAASLDECEGTTVGRDCFCAACYAAYCDEMEAAAVAARGRQKNAGLVGTRNAELFEKVPTIGDATGRVTRTWLSRNKAAVVQMEVKG